MSELLVEVNEVVGLFRRALFVLNQDQLFLDEVLIGLFDRVI